MFIWFLHNTFGPCNCGITPFTHIAIKSFEYWVLSRLQGLGRCDVLETLVSPYISPYVSRRSVQPGAFFTAQSTLFQSCFIMVVQLIIDPPIISGTRCLSWVKVSNSKNSLPVGTVVSAGRYVRISNFIAAGTPLPSHQRR